MRINEAIDEPAVIERILTHLGLQADCGRTTALAGATPARGAARHPGPR